ncbi:MAG: FAD binding domain-containing protein [Paracoccaceae bacterium]|nr:FAD binding domain-containing protein [Paracoccaceae bacterium]
MKAPDFDYHRAETLEAALALMAEEDAFALAGGQSLMPMMNLRLTAPEALVDLNAVDGLAGVRIEDQRLTIGAMTRYAALEASGEVAEHAPLVSTALPYIAHPAIRNRGTIGGSCALADPAAEMPALLLALGAEVHLQNVKGARSVAADEFFLGLYETAREDDELVVAIQLPVASKRQRIGFHEITRRHGDYAMAGCAIVATEDLSEVRIAFFAVSDRAVRARAAEAALAGTSGGKAELENAVAALSEIDFAGDMNASTHTKRHLAGVALRRAWAEVMA